MRNCHETFRKGISEILTPLIEIDDHKEFFKSWTDFQRCLHFHFVMENNYVFSLLDELCTGDQKKVSETFSEEHDKDAELIDNVKKEFLANGSVSKATYIEWKDHFLHHLQHEEKVMMPLTAEVHPSNPDRRYKVMFSRVINPLFNDYRKEFLFFVGYNIKILSTYGSTRNTAATAARVFAHGLQVVTTPEQWSLVLPVIKENVATKAIWDEMVQDYFIENPGYARLT